MQRGKCAQHFGCVVLANEIVFRFILYLNPNPVAAVVAGAPKLKDIFCVYRNETKI